jgi:hypothetical protein
VYVDTRELCQRQWFKRNLQTRQRRMAHDEPANCPVFPSRAKARTQPCKQLDGSRAVSACG